MKNTLYLMVLVFLSSFVGASCFNESVSSEDLEIGSQLIDVMVCKGIEVKDNMSLILPVFYFLFIVALAFLSILTVVFIVKVLT